MLMAKEVAKTFAVRYLEQGCLGSFDGGGRWTENPFLAKQYLRGEWANTAVGRHDGLCEL